VAPRLPGLGADDGYSSTLAANPERISRTRMRPPASRRSPVRSRYAPKGSNVPRCLWP